MDTSPLHRPLKIAILLDKFLPSRGGERYFTFLASELARMGHDVHIFASKVEATDNPPYSIHLIPVMKFPRSLRILSFRYNASRMLRRYDFDIIHGVAESCEVNVLNPHGGVEPAYLKQEFASIGNPVYRAYKFLKRYLSIRHYLETGLQKRLYGGKALKRVIAISSMIKRDIIRYYGFPEDRISVVFNSVDLDRFHPRNRELYRKAKRMELGMSEDTLLLLFAGNNFRLKGVSTLIKAMALLSKRLRGQDFRLVVAGRGHAGGYHRLAQRLGIADKVVFAGAVNGMEQWYGATDIYVHPTFYDSCSLTVLEALASGLPVITTKFNGAAEAIQSTAAGIVINDPADPTELAEAIAEFLDQEKRTRAIPASRACMERYSPERNLAETVAVYNAVTEETGPPRSRLL
jgi:UDP-glucose:(heptosyl)LPS alpha-1,3-glucosyltransferase